MRWLVAIFLVLTAAALGRADVSSPIVGSAGTQPASAGIQDFLNEIDALPASAAPSTHPASVEPAIRASQSDQRTSASSLRYWWDLIVFFAPGLAVGASIGIAGGVIGTFVLLRRESLLALALPQIVAVGAAAGLRLGWPTFPPALVAAIAGLGWIIWSRQRDSGGRGSSATIPALYIAGLSLSFLIIAGGAAHVSELQALFTGIDVAVTARQAALTTPVLLLAGFAAGLLWRRWLLIAQAPATARLAGVHPGPWDAIFLALLTLVLLLGTSAQGVVMVLAMLFLPAATVLPWARRIPAALLSAGVLAVCLLAGAFVLSNKMEWPLSQCVGGVGFAAFVLSNIATRVARR